MIKLDKLRIILVIIILVIVCIFGCSSNYLDNFIINTKKISVLEQQLILERKSNQNKLNEIALMNKQISELKEHNDHLSNQIEQCNRKIELGRGYAAQYMFDIDEIYNHLQCPIIPTTDVKMSKIAEQLVQALSTSEQYSNMKIITLRNLDENFTNQNNYVFEVLMFSPIKKEDLFQLIDDSIAIPFPSVRLYSVTVFVSEDNFNFRVN